MVPVACMTCRLMASTFKYKAPLPNLLSFDNSFESNDGNFFLFGQNQTYKAPLPNFLAFDNDL